MKEILGPIDRWLREGSAVVLARVVDVEGSGPRAPGAAMAVDERGEVVGSVSGGCVEGAVVTEALDVLRTGERRLVDFGYSDDEAFAVGLTCGGSVQLFVEPLDDRWTEAGLFDELAAAVRAGEPVALATVVDGPGLGDKALVRSAAGLDGDGDGSDAGTDATGTVTRGSLGDPDLDRVVVRDALGALAAGTTALRRYGPHGEAREAVVAVFLESFAPPPRLLVFGAVDFTAALARVAQAIGYRVTVCDARKVFATRARFPLVDELVVEWPDRLLDRIGPGLTPRDAVCVLTHDAKFDVPALVAALRTDAGYIGAMGSRRTHAERARRLREAGVDDQGLARIRSPIGLDLGSRTPEETAVSICAEIIADRTGRRDVRPLSETEGPIHRGHQGHQ